MAENRELTLAESINQRNPLRGLLLGTDFRHAVEFSRSGRATNRPSRASSSAACPLYPARRPPWRRPHAAQRESYVRVGAVSNESAVTPATRRQRLGPRPKPQVRSP